MAKKSIEAEQELKVDIPEKEETKEPEMTREEMTERFINQQLMVINKMKNKAKARRIAKRILKNRKGI